MDYKDITILFEDNHLLVVVKPVNVPVQEDESHDPDLLSMLKQYLVDTYNKPGEAYLGLVHRLDRPTGGVMVFAKTSKAAARISEAIANGEMEKRYLTIVEGAPKYKTDKLINFLKKFNDINTVKIVPELTDGAKYAELDYKVLAENKQNNVSLLMVNLITGRGHQIRVQMAGMGHPIVGDCRYGNGEKLKLPLCLWATELRLAHPISGKQMVFRVFPPEEVPWTLFDMEPHLNLSIRNS